MYQLLGFFTQNTKKALYVLEELGVDYEFQLVDLMKNEQKSEAMLKLNPFGKVPVLQHQGESLFESGAICRYVANVENSPLYPENKLARAKVDQWMDFFSCHLGKWLNTLFFQKAIKPLIGEKTDADACEEATKFSQQQLAVVDQHLGKQPYFVGDQLSIADLFAFAYIEQFKTCEISLDDYSNVKNWLEKISARDSMQRAQKKLER